MAKNGYIGIDSKARKIGKMYIGVNGVARKVKKAYIGVNGVAREWFSSGVPVGTLAVGSSVYMNVNGVRTEFLVVHQGVPDAALYDSSCDGTWLLMKDVYGALASFGQSTSYVVYKNSGYHTYLNGDFLALLDSDIQALIKEALVPTQGSVGGLSAKIFLLASTELGYESDSSIPAEGAVLDYFSGGGRDGYAGYLAYREGAASQWGLRTRCSSAINGYGYYQMTSDARMVKISNSSSSYIRPALILPSETLVDESLHIIT